jgi:peptidoglycan L-alanyl-D-glutamate endopeptidase CwlK
MGFRLGRTSLQRLKGVHPDMVRVCSLGIEYSEIDFTVTEGLRSIERQKELVAKGFSKTFQSKHLLQNDGFCHAFDVVAVGDLDKDGIVDAQDKALTWAPPIYRQIAEAMKRAASELGIAIRWGGDFKNFFDGPHLELVEPASPRTAGGDPLKA